MYGSFIHPALDSLVSLHRTVAVIGEVSYISRKVNENSKAQFDSVYYSVPKAMSWNFYHSWNKKKTKQDIAIQRPDTTYKILKRAGINPDSLSFFSRKTLSNLLGVDAIITVRWTIFKKHTGTEAVLISIASLAGSVAVWNSGYFGVVFIQFESGTEIIAEIITIHNADGQLIYLNKGLEKTFTNLNPGGWKNRKNLRDFPYKDKE